MLRALWQRPSVAVAACTVIVVLSFVASGDLGLRAPSAASAGDATGRTEGPVVVRRERAGGEVAPRVPLRGRVFDSMGFLIAGAELIAMQQDPVRTDGDGAFTLLVQPANPIDVLVRARGMHSRWLRLCDALPDRAVVVLEPTASWDPPPQPLPLWPELRGEGLALDAERKPIRGAFVTAAGSGLWAKTDDLGRFVLPLADGTSTLLLTGSTTTPFPGGFTGRAGPFVTPRSRGMVPLPEVLAAAAGAIRGTLRDAAGQPVDGAPVRLRGDGFERVFETASGGGFRLGGLAAGDYQLEPLAWRGALGQATKVALGGPIVELELTLNRVADARLRVVDGAGVCKAGVQVAATVAGLRRAIARSDRDGYAALPVDTQQATFEVRSGDGRSVLPIERIEHEPPTVVVSLP